MFIIYCVFPKNYRKFATSPSPELGCYWLYQKNSSQLEWLYTLLRWELWRSLTAIDVDEGGVAVNWGKKNLEHPIFTYIYVWINILSTLLSVYRFAHKRIKISLLLRFLLFGDSFLFSWYFKCLVYFSFMFIRAMKKCQINGSYKSIWTLRINHFDSSNIHCFKVHPKPKT